MAGSPTTKPLRRLRQVLLPGGLLLVPLAVPAAEPVSAPAPEITWESGDSLRAMAREHLGDADAWPDILRSNGLVSAHELRPGMRLTIPAAAIRRLETDLRELRGLIYQATEAGAQVFAGELLSEANGRRADALATRRRGDLAGAQELADLGLDAARRALKISLRNRDLPAEAVLDDAHGRVQLRRPSEFDWSPIAVKSLLAERDHLRTLSDASAQVRFRDASSLRLDENAQLAIRRLRHDALTRRDRVDLVLQRGGLRALLDPGAGQRAVKVEIPGVDTRVRSSHYWMQSEVGDARLANYDGEIEVSARGGTVLLGENQGTLVEAGAAPRPPVDLLSAPGLRRPEDEQVLYETAVELAWEPDPRARRYWLEVARDPRFKNLLLNATSIERSDYYLPLGDEGVYHWRVSAVDEAGLPGPPSGGRRFRLRLDQVPPFLTLTSPREAEQVPDRRVRLEGLTEPGVSLTANGIGVTVGPQGRFNAELDLAGGAGALLLEARDPAGNLTRLERRLTAPTGAKWSLRLGEDLPRDAQGRLLVNRPLFTLPGTSLPGAKIRVGIPGSSGSLASAVADASGGFRFILPTRGSVSDYLVDAVGPSGETHRKQFSVVLDQDPPRIKLQSEPDDRTSSPTLRLQGRVEGGSALSYGDSPVPLTPDGGFDLEIQLVEGANEVALRAWDLVGNSADLHRSLVLDREPPELLAHRVRTEPTTSGRVVLVELRLRDPSGVTAGVPYRLRLGDAEHSGVARRFDDGDCHRDRVALPPNTRAEPRLLSITPRDYLGNSREARLRD